MILFPLDDIAPFSFWEHAPTAFSWHFSIPSPPLSERSVKRTINHAPNELA